MKQIPEDELITIIINGDKEKFRILVEQYQQMVFRICMGFLHDKDDADDLTQEIFIRAYQSLPRFKGDSSFSTWLYRIAVNASLNKIRKSPLKLLFQRFDDIIPRNNEKPVLLPAPDEANPENILIRQEDVRLVQQALDSLPENQRTAIILSKYDDLSQKKIAGIMGTTEGAVEALLYRAKKNLRSKLLSLVKNN